MTNTLPHLCVQRGERERLLCLYKAQCAYGPEFCPSPLQANDGGSRSARSSTPGLAGGGSGSEYKWNRDSLTTGPSSSSSPSASPTTSDGRGAGGGILGATANSDMLVMRLRSDVWTPFYRDVRREEAYLERLRAKQLHEQLERQRLKDLEMLNNNRQQSRP